MSDTSPNLALPYIQPAQAQKHVTHNEAVQVLDLVTQLSVVSASLTVPPAEIIEGRRYIVPSGATGDWAGQGGKVAYLEQSAWQMLTPKSGWLTWVEDEAQLRIFNGTSWITPAAALPETTAKLGINTTADTTNRLAVAAPATLLTHGGAGHQLKINKATAGDTASLLFQTAFGGRAEMGTTGSDDFAVKVSPDGVTYREALRVNRATGSVELPQQSTLVGLNADPSLPSAGRISLYSRNRAGTGWLEIMRPSGRTVAFQSHLGINRVATWVPNNAGNLVNNGMPRSGTGSTSTPTLSGTDLSTSMRRWRMTSATTADSATGDRSQQWVCWRGNAPKLGGWTYVNRLSLSTLQSTGMGFFGLYGQTTAPSTSLQFSNVTACVGMGFQRGTHANWQVVRHDGSSTPSLTDLGAAFPVSSLTNVLTLFIYAAPNDTSVWVRVVEEVSGAAAEFEFTANIPAGSQFLSPHNFLNNGSAGGAVSYDCSGVYIETDY
jgi:hypothetical protein